MKVRSFPGAQPAILDRNLFDAVQSRLSEQLNNRTAALYDDRGNRMFASGQGVACLRAPAEWGRQYAMLGLSARSWHSG
jgi:hypothetical protein